MNNSILNIFASKEKKRYNQIIQAIENKHYFVLFELDNNRNANYGLTKRKYIIDIQNRIEQEVISNPDFVIQMFQDNYHRNFHCKRLAIKSNPEVIETFMDAGVPIYDDDIVLALDSGYKPSTDYINNHLKFFLASEIMPRLMDNGYRPSNEIIEEYSTVFANEELLTRILDLGFIPSLNFISKNDLLRNPNVVERVLSAIELTPELINSDMFVGNAIAQQIIISKKPELLLSLKSSSESFEQFWIESFEQGYIPEEVFDIPSIYDNLLLFSRIIKQKPEMIKHCKLILGPKRDKMDELALCMGYVPTISEARNSDYIKTSPRLMKALILSRPEAIKYVGQIPFKGSSIGITYENLFDLIQLALDNGYIPTLEDIEYNPLLSYSFDIMKILIQDNPKLINKITYETENQEELLKIAIANGFDGDIVERYKDVKDNSAAYGGHSNKNKLLITETYIIYQFERGKLDDRRFVTSVIPGLRHDYSINLYKYLIGRGNRPDDIIDLFVENHETMKLLISQNPEYITKLETRYMSKKEFDELGLLAINNGYIPKFEDGIFGFGLETAKLMVKKYPSYIEKVDLCEGLGNHTEPKEGYDEICKIAVEGGYLPDVEKLGHDGITVYDHSYDIMKKVIPIRPNLIESCRVTNKEQYDELCRLAISCGYEITSDYILEHYGKRMKSNYDLMALYIKNHPDFLPNVEITKSDEMLGLLNIAINAGLQLDSLEQNDLLKIFLLIDETKWADYLGNDIIVSLQKTNKIYENNNEVSKTINPQFLSDSIISHFTSMQVEILSCYPDLQKMIVGVSFDRYKAGIIYEIVDKYKDNLEWIPILEKALKNINSPEFGNLLGAINGKELSQDEKNNLFILLITDNHLDIATLDELKNLDSVRDNYIKMLIERDTLGSLKTAYFEKVYGIDLATAINLVNLYGTSLESKAYDYLDESGKAEFSLLENMKKIINLNNIDLLRYYVKSINPNFIVTPDLMVTYEARLKYLFTSEFNKSFNKPLEEDRIVSNINSEQDFAIYLAAGHDGKKKCRMMITSLGAYTSMDEPDDYYASWNIDKIESHGCCCSYIGENNLGTAEIKYCCLGFTDYEFGSLHLSAPYDLVSMSSSDSFAVQAVFSSMYLLPDDVLGYTRHTHNETVWERRNITENSMFKKQPSYIVYFVDNFEDRLTDPDAMRQWESVKKAASNFTIEVDGVKRPLPIMVVEREKIAKSQLEIIQAKLSEFKETLDPQLIGEIISDYESNYAGNRKYHLSISSKYFPIHEQLSDSVVGEIIEKIKEIYQTKPDLAIQCIYELEKAVKSEQQKYSNTKHGGSTHASPSFDIEEAMIDINKLKSNFRVSLDSSLIVANNCDENQKQFEKSDIQKIDQETLDAQLLASDVVSALSESGLSSTIVMIENEIKDENVNGKLKVHGQRHIKNVLLYATLIGQSVVQDKHDLDLLMISAKYHDIGRKTDAFEEHAESSSKIAAEKLKDKCSEEDISIISTIIEFHEVPRDYSNVDSVFAGIAKRNGVPEDQIPKVRQMAEILKDADALDRTRFINKARLDPKFLHYDISKRLVRFASSLQEAYAIKDLKEFRCDEAIEVLLHRYTPQEVLRIIRHSTRANLRIEDIQAFIKLWAQSSAEKEVGVVHEV